MNDRGVRMRSVKAKPPGGEDYLDPPGIDFSKLGFKAPSKCVPDLVALRHNNFVNHHVVAILDVVNANLRIFSHFRSIDNTSIRSHVGDRLAELVVHRFARFSFQDQRLARSEVGDGAETFGRRGCGFSCSSRSRGRGGGCLPVSD